MTTIRYANGVTCARKPDARGMYRVRWTDRHGNRKDARRQDATAARKLAEKLSLGLDPSADLDGARDGATVADLVEHFLDPDTHDRSWSKSYRDGNTGICRKWVQPHLGRLAVTDWRSAHSRDLLRAMEAAGLLASTRRRNLTLMQRLVAIAQRDGWIDHDPCAGVTVSTEEITIAGHASNYIDPEELPTHADLEKLATAMVEHTGQDWRWLQVMLSAYSGLRCSEMLALSADQISLDAGTIDVRAQLQRDDKELVPPKGRKRRKTIYPSWLDEAVADRVGEVGPGGLLFPGADGDPEPYSTWRLSRYVDAAEACGWKPRFVWHDLRHYFCTWALMKAPEGLGLPVQDVSLFAGHHSPSLTFDVYVGVSGDAFARAREASR